MNAGRRVKFPFQYLLQSGEPTVADTTGQLYFTMLSNMASIFIATIADGGSLETPFLHQIKNAIKF